MLVTFKKQQGLKRPMNLTGISRFVYGNNNKDLHTHTTSSTTTYIDHTTVSNTRKVVRDVFVINADPTR